MQRVEAKPEDRWMGCSWTTSELCGASTVGTQLTVAMIPECATEHSEHS